MDSQEPIYPETPTKEVVIPKEGYNSMSVLQENADGFVVQLYNPNTPPPPPAVDPEAGTPTA